MSRPRPAGGDLAGRWLSRFLTSHLAAERDVPAQTIASYRDAIRLLLTWFRDMQAIPPGKLRLADIDRARVLAFLDWLQAERGNSASTRNQRLAAIRSFIRYTAIERPEFPGQATQIIAIKQKKTPAADMGHLSGDEVKALLAEPDPATRRGQRNTVLLSTLYDTAARVQEICDLNTRDVRVARPMVVTLHGKGSKTRRVPLMDPTAQLIQDYLSRRAPHPGVGGAMAGDRGAQHPGEPHRVGAAHELAPGQEPGPVIDDARQEGGLAGHPRPVHQVRGPDLVHRVGLEPAERLRRGPARPGGQLPGREPALDRPLRGRPAQPDGQDPADLRRGPGRVLHLQPGRQLHHVGVGARRALPGRRHQRVEPAGPARPY